MVTLPHGETNITLACQNRCVSCNHFVAIQKPWHADLSCLERDLFTAAKVMHFDVYNLVGGEPTLHPRIVEALAIVRASRISDRVEITSNGQNFGRLPDEFYMLLDDLIITPYKLTDDERTHIIDKCAENGVSLSWHPVIFQYAAFKTANPERGAYYYRDCWYRRNRNVIDEGYFHRCCIGRFIPELLQGKDRNAEAIALEGLTEETLRAFLDDWRVPEMCNVCGCNQSPIIQWSEEADPQKWIEASLGE